MQRFDPIQILSELVVVDSQSQKSNINIIHHIGWWFPTHETTIQPWIRQSDDLKGENLIVKIPGKNSSHSLVFVCHMDTVPASASWETDPFILEEKEGNLYGLGACDTKGGVASLISAVLSLQDTPSYDTYIVFDGDEEVDSTGACTFLKKMNIVNPHFIFIEPTDQQICITQRALLKIDITTQGVASHASQATPGKSIKENAINKMCLIMNILRKDAEKIADEKHPHLHTNTQNFGFLTAGTARNVIADHAKLQMERRLLPQRDPIREFDRVKSMILDAVPDAIVTMDEVEPGFATDEKNPFVRNVLHITNNILPSISIGAFPAWSEAGLFAQASDVIVMGPGSLIKQAHRANEFVSGQEILQYVDIFKKILTDITFS